MLKAFQGVLVLGCVLAQASVSDAAMARPQRSRISPPPSSSARGTNPLDALGIMQPESVRSILLLYLARNMSKAKVNELEADLVKHPDNIDDRLSLIGYYNWTGQTANQLRLRTLVLWMIENHPEHAATGEPALRDLLDDSDGNIQILALWNKNMETRGDEYNVLKNAEKFFFSRNPETAEAILHRLYEKDPVNREWPTELAKLYNMFGIPGFNSNDPEEKANEAYRRVLQLTRDPRSREALAGDMADAAFRVGDFSGAATLAKVYLKGSDRAAPQRGNILLGRIALRSDDLQGAKQYLLDSSEPASARYISVSGPIMTLAKELLDKGERDVVVQYLEKVLPIWTRGEDILHIWITDIKSGRTPDFGHLGF